MLIGTSPRPEDLVAALGARPVIAHDAKSLGLVPERLAHDTEVAAYLLEPARRAYPFRELTEERGLAAEVEDEAGADAVLAHALAEWQREEIRGRGLTDLLNDVELPIVRVLRDMEMAGVKLDTDRLKEISERVKTEADALEREIFDLAEEFTLGSPKQARGDPVRQVGAVAQAAGQDRGLHRRPGAPGDPRGARDHPPDRALAGADEAGADVSRRPAPLVDSRTAAAHLLQPDGGDDRPAVEQQPQPPEHPHPDAGGRRIRASFVAERGNLLVSADYSQIELRHPGPLAGEDVLTEIFERARTCTPPPRGGSSASSPRSTRGCGEAKMINFGVVYGMSSFGLADGSEIPQPEADEFIETYFAGFPAVALPGGDDSQGTEHGYVSTLLGRRR